MTEKKRILLKLFTTTFYLSTFTFGGGFVIIPLMKKQFVDKLKWLEEKEMLNLVGIAQSSPGAVAVNASIIVGYRLAGKLGAFISIIGTVLPPLIILSFVSLFYNVFIANKAIAFMLTAMQAGVAAVIVDVVIEMGGNLLKEKSIFPTLIMVGAFSTAFFLNINIIYIILFSGLLGAFQILLAHRCRKVD